jgi:hypothetical protein
MESRFHYCPQEGCPEYTFARRAPTPETERALPGFAGGVENVRNSSAFESDLGGFVFFQAGFVHVFRERDFCIR